MTLSLQRCNQAGKRRRALSPRHVFERSETLIATRFNQCAPGGTRSRGKYQRLLDLDQDV